MQIQQKLFILQAEKKPLLFSYILVELDFDKFILLFSHRFFIKYFSFCCFIYLRCDNIISGQCHWKKDFREDLD